MTANHQLLEYRRKARERLTSEKGLEHRSKRPIEPEAVFGQIKYNMQYKRFRHFGKDKVTMDFAFFAMAFNLKKMAAKMPKWSNSPVLGPFPGAMGHKNGPSGHVVERISASEQKMAAKADFHNKVIYKKRMCQFSHFDTPPKNNHFLKWTQFPIFKF